MKADGQSPDMRVVAAFQGAGITIPLASIQSLREVSPSMKRSAKYAQILASVVEIGIIEPPVVVPLPAQPGRYLLLDGRLRIEVLKDQGHETVTCLVATDDEAFTYNKQVSRLATVQEHRMILNAIEKGVPEERIARAFNIDIKTLKQKRRMLHGICAEAVEILKDKPATLNAFELLKRMSPLRQIEVAELMVMMNHYSKGYVEALLMATPQAQLATGAKPKQVKGVSEEQVALMERESTQLDREIKAVEQSYGSDHLLLVVARGYLTKLLASAPVVRYLAQQRPEFLAEFQKIAETDGVSA
jgi:hypothetical protein